MNAPAFAADLARFQRACAPDLSVVDCTGIVLGNADLEASCTWVPTVVPQTPDYVLPSCAHVPALASIERAA